VNTSEKTDCLVIAGLLALSALPIAAGGVRVLALGVGGETARTVFMGAGWAINLAMVEWLIWRWPKY
jgi:hypothetical protein